MAILSDTWSDLAETHQAQLHPCASGHMDKSPQSTKPGTPGKKSLIPKTHPFPWAWSLMNINHSLDDVSKVGSEKTQVQLHTTAR